MKSHKNGMIKCILHKFAMRDIILLKWNTTVGTLNINRLILSTKFFGGLSVNREMRNSEKLFGLLKSL